MKREGIKIVIAAMLEAEAGMREKNMRLANMFGLQDESEVVTMTKAEERNAGPRPATDNGLQTGEL